MSESTALPNACPKCDAALPADAAEGLCPRCLMAEAMLPTGPKKAWEPPTAAELGELLPEYDIEKLLGRGGMGAVYKGRQKSLDRPVAIKILSSTLDESDQGFAERFKNEARALGKLKHPGIVGVYDFGTAAGGLLYIVMEFIDGTDVAKMIAKSGRLHTEHAMAITAHVCDALAYAHERGIIHRDIKPANIMVGYDGVVQVADFGLAKMTHSQNTGLTQSGMAMGTLHYMAPESLMLGTSVDHRADIYAVGVMLYQMLTGKLPQGLFNMPSLQIKGLDPRYDRIIGKALMEDREERYQSVTEMRMGLDEILTQPVVKAEAGAGKPPAALNTQARPKRSEAKDEPLVGLPNDEHAGKRSFNWQWAVLIILLALGAWEYLRKRPAVTLPSDDLVNTVVPEVTPPLKAGSSAIPAVPPTASAPVASAAPVPSPRLPAVSQVSPTTATKEQPFVNSLGMKFVPVPGTNVLMCIHETRSEDYSAFAENEPGVDVGWKTQSRYGVPCGDKPDHPVVGVTWEHAQQFCRWLSEKEGKTYRLPADQEWSVAVGLGADETRVEGGTPQSLSGKQTTEFPWGRNYPPLTPDKVGNYADTAWHEKWPDEPAMPGLTDGFPTTAPVMSFKPNAIGLYDMGGNVWEWVNDWANAAQKDRVLRGGAFTTFDKGALSSVRFIHTPEMGYYYDHGFRVVLELDGGTQRPPSASDTSSALSDPPNTTRRVIDLIQTASLQPASQVDTWQLKGTDLEFVKGGEIVFPHACGTQEYDLEFEFTVLTAEVNSIGHSFPTAVGRCAFTMQLFREHPGPFWGFAILDDVHYAFAKEARVVKDYPPLFEAGKRYQTTVKVRDGSLEAYLNGRLLVHWEGDQSRFTTGETNLPHPRHPKFGIYDGRAIIHKATVTEFVPNPASPPAPSVAPVTKEQPFVNSLGMKFLPVKIEGGPTSDKRVLFSVWHTRVQDYKVFVEETKRGWPGAGFAQAPTHPAVLVSWEDAKAFCAWMTQRDRTAGKIRPNDGYRLPTDHEWSCAVGLGAREDWTLHPAEKNSKVRGVFPWGTQWPPPQGAGNYAGEELQQALKTARFPDVHGVIAGFNDGFETTAPVGSFAANSFGLHDMGGNVWSWCEDWSDKDQKHRVLRGGSWITHLDVVLLSSNRGYIEPLGRFHDLGFRLVLEMATTPPDASASKSQTSSKDALLEQQYQAAIAKQVTPAVEAYAKTLLTSYRSALERASKASGTSPAEAAALKAEIVRVSNEAVMPLSDAPGISAAIAALRSTYRKALEAFRVEKTAPLNAVYDKQLQEQVKITADKASQTPGPSSMPPDGSTSSPRIPTTPTAADHLRWRQIAERLLALKAELTIAEGNRAQSVRKIEELPAGPFMLRRIWLIDSALTDDDLAMLAGSSELSVVNIDGSSVTRFPFAELPGLEFFHYNRGLCTDDTLEGIENCQRLTELFLSGSKLSKTSLRRLKNCPKLERLCLSATNIDSDDLKELGQLINLKHVDLSHTQITGKGLAELQGLSLLEDLRVTHLDLTGSNLDFLSNFKNLNKLSANSTQFDDKHFLLIGGLKALKRLDLEDVQMNDRHVATISQCLSLEELVVPRTEITGMGFAALAEWPSLARLNLAGTRLSKDGLRSVTETCPHLTELTLPASPLSADNMARLSKLTKLKSLEIQDGRFDRTWVPFMERMDQLEWLHLTRTTVSDADVAAIAKLTRLTRLGLTGTQITDACIPEIMMLRSLGELWLSGTAITEAGRAKLKDMFPAATIHQ